MHVSRDLGLHKLIIMPPSRPNDSSSMVAKISWLTPLHQTTLLKSEQHKESSILMGLDRGATPWVLLGSELTWVMGFFIPFPYFPCILAISNGLWAVIQKSAAWTVPELMISGGMEGWNELEMLEQFENGRPAALVMFERMGATVPLFISENKTWCGLQQQQIYSPSLDSFSFWLHEAYRQAVHGCLSVGLLST